MVLVARKGIELERLVALTEVMLGGPIVEVESPAVLPGQLSGSMREVDVLATASVGSTRVRVLLEARDHKRRQGPAWVEQVAAKRRDVAADVAIAVSSSGFTPGAEVLTSREGVRLRTVRARSAAYVRENMYYGLQPYTVFDNDLVTVIPMEKPGGYSPITMPRGLLYPCHSDAPLTEPDLLSLFPDEVWQHAVVEGCEVRLEFRMRIPRPDGFAVEVRSDGQHTPIAELYIKLVMTFHEESLEVSDVYEYVAPDGIAYVVFSATIPSIGLTMPVAGQTSGPPQIRRSEVFLVRMRSGPAGRHLVKSPLPLGAVDVSKDGRAASMIAFAAQACRNPRVAHLGIAFSIGGPPSGEL